MVKIPMNVLYDVIIAVAESIEHPEDPNATIEVPAEVADWMKSLLKSNPEPEVGSWAQDELSEVVA